ncbi:phosphotransferase [Butyrivibrio fibrisolvens]|uniref:phosphotransferase n=1 Tax=Pseudobutyrivibrio ruminis TaxID=46206 RepID=UPI0003F7C5B3|nr:phosphotransferase [Pseudobutyrivibrio ruminis]MDC7279112.1 phosphotransferase [Butyrivibrio fibrisolvens]
MRRVFIKEKSEYIDVSDRRMVLWSAGFNSRKISIEYQLNNIDCVVDGNPEKQGTSLILCGKEYTVLAPEIIRKENVNEYFILIGSTDYKASIMKDINTILGEKVIVCDDIENLIYGYNELDELFWDPRLFKEISEKNISLKIPYYIDKIKQITKDFFKGEVVFIPLYSGTRLCFRTLGQNEDIVFHIPAFVFREEYSQSSKTFIYNSCLAIKNIKKINTPIIYIDEEGLVIEKYCKPINWSKKLVESAVLLLKDIHLSGNVINVKHSFKEKLQSKEQFILGKKAEISDDFLDVLHNIIYAELEEYEACLCHGDAYSQNMGMLDNKIVMYDWEWVGMSDPMFDLVNFYYDIGKKYYGMDEILELYLGRIVTNEELFHANIIYVAIQTKDYFNLLRNNLLYNNHTYEKLLVEEVNLLLTYK